MNVRRLSISGLSLSTLLSIGIFAAPQKQDKKNADGSGSEKEPGDSSTVPEDPSFKKLKDDLDQIKKDKENPGKAKGSGSGAETGPGNNMGDPQPQPMGAPPDKPPSQDKKSGNAQPDDKSKQAS